jgi:hypothetical protein
MIRYTRQIAARCPAKDKLSGNQGAAFGSPCLLLAASRQQPRPPSPGKAAQRSQAAVGFNIGSLDQPS